MRKQKTTAQSICESRKIVMPEQINPHGTLFGGVIMTWIDKVAYMCAQNYAECLSTVTATIDQVKFLSPVHVGDQVVIRAIVSHVGDSSMEIDVSLHKENPVTQQRQLVGEAFLTFVALGENRKKMSVPLLVLESEDDFYRQKNALSRINQRAQMKRLQEEHKVSPYPHLAPPRTAKLTSWSHARKILRLSLIRARTHLNF